MERNVDESRKQFEQEFARINRIPLEDVISCRYEDDYWDESHLNTRGISMAWKIWQASRAAIKIELPDIEVITGNYTAPGDGWEVYDAQETDKAIRAAGIKVKGA
jgi:hypothetical protein